MRGQLTYHHVMDGVWGVEKYSPLPKQGATFSRAGGAKINMRKLCAKPTKAQKKAAFKKMLDQNRKGV
jgi:hypothetical protein